MPACADLSQAVEEFSSPTRIFSEQHEDSTKARFSRDNSDMEALAVFLDARNPLRWDPSLQSITSGVIVDKTVNVDIAKEDRDGILKSMEGKPVEKFVFNEVNTSSHT